jgi:4-hydroxybenzoate polyprenyltransferase
VSALVATLRANRWYIYQRERFPVVAHGLLVASFSSAAICFSALLRGADRMPSGWLLAAGFVSSFLIFLQLRICDEFKDAEDDARWRAYRPVPRGVVTLGQLRVVGIGSGVVLAVIALRVNPVLLVLLAGVWAYLALMSAEFFVPRWLKAHPSLYLLSHMMIMPLIDFFISGFDWSRAHVGPPPELAWFLAVSFFNGVVVEVGRKIRGPQDEEEGVETYSKIWGIPTSVGIWLAALAVAGVFALGAAHAIHLLRFETVLLAGVYVAAATVATLFVRRHRTVLAKGIEGLSALWTLLMYLGLGTIPLLVRSV